MREILFRGKRVDSNEWVYGYYIAVFSHSIVDNRGVAFEVESKTIGQYAGLKDKNGKKIFEGDKVMFDYDWTKPNEVGVITWNESNASFQIKGHIPSSSMKHLNQMKVIGNIFDKEAKQ